MKKFSKEIKIGLAAIVSLVLLYIGINFLKGINLFKPANYYYVACNNVADITISSPVYVDGFKVGLVRAMNYDYASIGKITLEISMDKGMRVNKNSYVSIESTMLSGAQLHLKLNKYVTEYHHPGDTLEGRNKAGMMSSIESEILPDVKNLLPKLDSILVGLNTLINSPALANSLANLETTTQGLTVATRQLNTVLQGDLPEITGNLKSTSSNLSVFSTNLNELDLRQSINSLNGSLGNLNSMTLRLNSTDNSLGLLLNDTTLYKNLNFTLENASGLLIDLKQNPKRYVKLSLF
ncbi:MAG: MlaD family protein [Tannerella sp.]|nr:MlaD family protein [Tannerella sp.]